MILEQSALYSEAGGRRARRADGQPNHTHYDYWTYGGVGEAPPLPPMSSDYHGEHGSLSYNTDLFVLTRTDAAGYGIFVAPR